MNKRLVAVIATTFMAFSVMSTSVLASPNPGDKAGKAEVIVEKGQITDIDKLFDRAKNRISDIEDESISPKAKGMAISRESGRSIDAHVLSTTQLLKEEKQSNGDIVKTYATTSFAILPESELLDGAQAAMSITSFDASYPNSAWDSSGGVRAYGTIFWKWSFFNGITFASMADQRNTGGWNLTSGYTLSNKKVTFGQSGMTAQNGYKTQNSTFYPFDSLSWEYPVPFTWIAVKADQTSYLGQTVYCRVNRGSGSWDFYFYDRQYAGGM